MKFPSSSRSVGHAKLQEHLESHCEEGFTVLEAGCGSGLISLELAMKKSLRSLVLLDIRGGFLSLAMKKFVENRKNLQTRDVEFVIGDIHKLPFAEESFDLVFNEGVIEHLDNMEKGVSEMARVSRRIVLIFIPNYYNPLWKMIKRWKRWRGEFYYGADEYGLEKDITHKMVVKWLVERGYEVKLLEIGGLKRDIPFPKALKTSIGILGKRV